MTYTEAPITSDLNTKLLKENIGLDLWLVHYFLDVISYVQRQKKINWTSIFITWSFNGHHQESKERRTWTRKSHSDKEHVSKIYIELLPHINKNKFLSDGDPQFF